MRWFNKWFYRQFCRAQHRGAADFPDVAAYAEFLNTSSLLTAPRSKPYQAQYTSRNTQYEFNYSNTSSIQIEIVSMHGGHVVTFIKDDPSDRNNTIRANYIISADEDFDQALIKLLALERIKG